MLHISPYLAIIIRLSREVLTVSSINRERETAVTSVIQWFHKKKSVVAALAAAVLLFGPGAQSAFANDITPSPSSAVADNQSGTVQDDHLDRRKRPMKPTNVVVIGDSFISGEDGVGGTYIDNTPCSRSTTSVVLLASARKNWNVNNVACSGATTYNVVEAGQYPGMQPQVTALNNDTDEVVVMYGGNDLGFGDLVVCIITTNCDETGLMTVVLGRVEFLADMKLNAADNAVKSGAPKAKVTVVLYPPLLPNISATAASSAPVSPNCPEVNGFEALQGYRIQKALNNKIAGQARAHGFRVVDLQEKFKGRGICANDNKTYFHKYVPNTVPDRGTYHPTLEGRRVMASSLGIAA